MNVYCERDGLVAVGPIGIILSAWDKRDDTDLGTPWPDNLPACVLLPVSPECGWALALPLPLDAAVDRWRAPGGCLPNRLRVLFTFSAVLRHGVTLTEIDAMADLLPTLRGIPVAPLCACLPLEVERLLMMFFYTYTRTEGRALASQLAAGAP